METSNATTVGPLDYAGSDVYRDHAAGWRREFILNGDRLIIRARKLFQTDWEVPIALRNVDPVFARMHRRNSSLGNGALAFLALSATLFFLISRDRDQDGIFCTTTVVTGCVFGLLGLFMGIRYLRRIELAYFGLSGGPRFDIARNGPDGDRFDAFLSRIVGRIHELQSTGAAQPMAADQKVDFSTAPTGPATSIDPYSSP